MRSCTVSLKFAIASRSFPDLSSEEVVDVAHRFGLVGIEWSEDRLHGGEARQATKARESARGAGFEVAGYASTWHVGRGPFGAVVDSALAIGARTIRLRATGLASGNDRDAATAELRDALDVAQTAGIVVSLSCLPAALDATLRFVREIAHPNLRLYWRAPATVETEGFPATFRHLRFCVPDVRIDELTTPNRRRVPEGVVRARILNGASKEERFAIFDTAFPGLGRPAPRRSAEHA